MRIRAATTSDATGLARVHVDTWQATYRGMVADAYLDRLSHERSTKGWEKSLASPGRQRTFVAEDEKGSVVGFASGGPNRDADTLFKAELQAIYILPARQGQGVGKALLRRFAEAMVDEGMDSLVTWALAANTAARRFYESAGGSLAAQRKVEIGGESLDEVAYGWPDIRVLLSG